MALLKGMFYVGQWNLFLFIYFHGNYIFMKTNASQSFINLSRVLTYFVLFHRMHFNNLSRVLKCFVFLECLSLKCFRHSVQAQDWGETKLGFFNINRILTIGQTLAFSLLTLPWLHSYNGCFHGNNWLYWCTSSKSRRWGQMLSVHVNLSLY